MVNLLVALGQAVCVCGLVYGAYLSIRYSDAFRGRKSAHPKGKAWLCFPIEQKRHPEPIGSIGIRSDSERPPHARA